MDDASRKLFDEGIELLTSTADKAELELGDGYIAKMAEAGMECNDITPENKQGFIDATASVRDEYSTIERTYSPPLSTGSLLYII